mmetsp:Transcript_9842/g.39913  ORF Transcript_9842/g.39913 Transcript_9842/m.39913 type:complete len:525 (-) Transcript_9842:38-1612(-)
MAYASQESVGQAEGMGGGSSGGSNPLENVFFVFDEDGGDERCPVDEILVYFHPEEGLELDQKLFLQGSISAMVAFAEQFNQDRVQVMLLKSVKFAIKKVPPFTLVVTANVAVGDGELMYFIESLYAAYRFHYGGLNNVAERFTERAAFLQCVQKQLALLVPMMQAARRRSALRPFVELPFCTLPPNCSRFFMAASQYLSRRRRDDQVRAGAVFFDSAVLCTHMDILLTRWVHNRLENLLLERAALSGWQRVGERGAGGGSSNNVSPAGFASAPGGLSSSGGSSATSKYNSVAAAAGGSGSAPAKRCFAFPVFLTFEQLQEIGLKQSAATDDDLPEEYSYVSCPPPGGEYVTLVIICVSRLSVGLILPLATLFDESQIRRLHRDAEQELSGLSSSISAAYHKGTVGMGPVAGNRDSSGGVGQEYHFLTTDEITGMLRGSVIHKGTPLTEREERFLQGSAFAHELFRSDDISKVLLGDPGGMLYCRNMFSKEIYYMRNGNSTSDVTLEKLEANAQYNLHRQNIQLI